MFSFVHKLYQRFTYATKGILYAARNDSSFKMQFYFGFLFILGFGYLMRPLTQSECHWLIFAWILVLITELQNSAFEAAIDRMHPAHHEEIGRSKDMAAGSVLIAGLFALFVVLSIVFAHL